MALAFKKAHGSIVETVDGAPPLKKLRLQTLTAKAKPVERKLQVLAQLDPYLGAATVVAGAGAVGGAKITPAAVPLAVPLPMGNTGTTATSGSASTGTGTANISPSSTKELLEVLVKITDEICYEDVDMVELKEASAKIYQLFQLQDRDSDTSVRVKLLELLSGLGCECTTEAGVILIIDHLIYLLRKETSQKVLAQGMMCLYRIGDRRRHLVPMAYNTQVAHLAREALRSGSTHTQKNAMLVIGRFATRMEGERHYAWKLAFYIDSQDSGVRAQALHALLTLGERGSNLPAVLYKRAVDAMKDDYECVRKEALRLVYMLGNSHPDFIIASERQQEDIRMIDAAFSKVCEALCDLSLQIRVLAAELLGGMTHVSREFLHQTLDKKLMSNLRRKRTAHERGARLVASGEWSSGKRWADDAPQERLDARSISIIASGACGALIHGLEDEFLEVRTAAVSSMCKLALSRSDFALTSLDFLVDMFNDEIEDVRLKAIYSLTAIARHIVLREDQLETMLSSLEDYSVDVREGLHLMLGACRVSTQTCLLMVVQKLLDVLAKYPQDRHSTYACMRKIGQKHPHLVMAVAVHLLYVHPFFETPERDVEDPTYLCVLILVFNAAEHLMPIISLLPTATHRHYAYLRDSMPRLVPQLPIEGASSSCTNHRIDDAVKEAGSSAGYLKMILSHIDEIVTMSDGRVELLKTAQSNLQRLGDIDSGLYGTSNFLETFLSAQIQIEQMQRCAKAHRSRVPLKESLAALITKCLKLQHTFSGLSYWDILQVKQLRLRASALHLVLVVKDRSQSALGPCQMLLQTAGDISEYIKANTKEEEQQLAIPSIATGDEEEDKSIKASTNNAQPDCFTRQLLSKLDAITDPRPGRVFREILPLVQNAPPLALPPANEKIRRCMASIIEPCPLQSQDNVIKVTAGLIAAVPFVAEIDNLQESQKADMRIKIKYPDQHMHTVVPKMTDFKPIMTEQGEHETNVRLRTTILLSHSVWTEASLVEIQLCLAVRPGSELALCKPAKVLFAPKPVRRGI
ncbi:integrator complex subunit 4 [Drosophila guanche]|uniref:Blast:Integrator complex subunit 4 n=1 Tax=Drosophila guanche TaxID=7266 RepID=A0A3B0K3U9_DROGU|nr:integrator complex subunit 4 [Drosophila guanche]SPP78108.1 blast:Integrator complex subunit 4 [Drosophila guanche]